MIAASSQYVAAALQNVTVPTVTGTPFDTLAVSVTTVPEVTEDDESVRVVVVGHCSVRQTHSKHSEYSEQDDHEVSEKEPMAIDEGHDRVQSDV